MLLEHQAKQLLAQAGLAVPAAALANSPAQAAEAAAEMGGEVVVKAQVPVGGRGKAGAILQAATPSQVEDGARQLLGTHVDGHVITSVLVEEKIDVRAELYVAVSNDTEAKRPVVLLSTEGGVDIEEVHAARPEKIHRQHVDIRHGLSPAAAEQFVSGMDQLRRHRREFVSFLVAIYDLYRQTDAELVEVNPLAVTTEGALVALDCKMSLDPAAFVRHPELPHLHQDRETEGTPLERRAAREGLLYIELDGQVGVLANGAGLTMATLDAVSHYGGRPANFLEIGGDAYTKAEPALRIVVGNPNVKSLLVNFCGAFARTDVMVRGVVEAIEKLHPDIPISFSIHGTGEQEAIQLVRERLGIDPHCYMDDAVKEAVDAAAGTRTR
jgi:succinyl-CoA synthetase beta subunit